MIGVIASVEDLEIAAEFFQLFKTPWEPAVPGRRYDAILSSTGHTEYLEADLVLVYGATSSEFDRDAGIHASRINGVEVDWEGRRFPVFGPATLFQTRRPNALKVPGGSLDYAVVDGSNRTQRVGYDLFTEVRHLLTVGQPIQYASVPTLEIHIALLRHWLTQARVPFVELLPRPAAHDFICCLTHDIDFVGLRRHFCDRTFAGFVLRASLGTAVDVLRRRRPFSDMLENLNAVCTLPLMFLGLTRDLWRPFEDYATNEDARHSTFFVIPFKDRPGLDPTGKVNAKRAARYQLSEVAEELKAATDRGSEIGIHGIDAWRDTEAGRTELQQLETLQPKKPGIRMHWLYFSDASPKHLEAAGFAYDTTWGYNSRIGFRAGTTQVFRLPQTEALLELPLAIMDSALLSAERLGLTQRAALAECRSVIDDVQRFGGTLVVNWHCRSLAPERLWGALYRQLLMDIRADDRAWFTTASGAVDWFRWRRAVRMSEFTEDGATFVGVTAPSAAAMPGLLRVHRVRSSGCSIEDFPFDGATPAELALSTTACVSKQVQTADPRNAA